MAKDPDYEAAVEKGTKLLQMLNNKFRTSVASEFKHIEELAQHGYHLETKRTGFEIGCIAEALRDLNVDHKMTYDGGENVRIHHQHGASTAEGNEYTVSHIPLQDSTCTNKPLTIRGYFSQVSNPRAGVLIADSNLTPSHAAAFEDSEEEEGSVLPLLNHWSDVAFLQYLSSFPSPPLQPISLNYVFRIQIQNSETFLVLNKIISMHGHSAYDVWPGITFDIQSEEGKAILGTPHGSGVAWMLIQHSKALGERTITRVTVFYAPRKGDLFRWPSLLFWIA